MSYRIPLGSVWQQWGLAVRKAASCSGAGVITQASLADGREAHHVHYRVRHCLYNDFPENICLYICIYIYILAVPNQLANYIF